MTPREIKLARACPASQLQARALSWLWAWRLADGKLAILEGDPGLGKSLVALDLCARLSTGRPWPDGSPNPVAGSAIVINGEDGAEDTIRARLLGLGADLDRVFVLKSVDEDHRGVLSLPTQTLALEAALEQTRARLVVIDPVLAFLSPGVNPANDLSIRYALAPLAHLAERYRCVSLMVRNLNKGEGARAMYRGLGSIGLVGVSRTAWLVVADPRSASKRVMAQVKNNYAPPQPSLGFEVPCAADAAPSLHWLGLVEQTADALLAAGAARRLPRPQRECARDFLLDCLRDGPRTTREIWAQGEMLGLSERTLRRAKDDLKVRLIETTTDGKRATYWLLPRQELPPEVAPTQSDPEFWEMLEQLNKQYPRPTPLDDFEPGT